MTDMYEFMKTLDGPEKEWIKYALKEQRKARVAITKELRSRGCPFSLIAFFFDVPESAARGYLASATKTLPQTKEDEQNGNG